MAVVVVTEEQQRIVASWDRHERDGPPVGVKRLVELGVGGDRRYRGRNRWRAARWDKPPHA
jgi:hypothetical protein